MHEPHAFVALYAGDTIAGSRVVGASTDPELIRLAATVLLRDTETRQGSRLGERLAEFGSLLRRLATGFVRGVAVR